MRNAILEGRANRVIQQNENWKKIEQCPVCEIRNDFEPYLNAQDHHYGIKGVFSLYRCKNCTLVFLNPIPMEKELNGLYPETYYSYQDLFEPNAGLKWLLRKLSLIEIGTRDPAFAKPGRILDLGCGSGKFLYKFRERGWETFGVEISKPAAELGQKAAGLNIFGGTLDQAAFPDNYFDYIRSNHSFEHILNPNEILTEIRRILKPDGKLLIAVPNVDGWVSKVFNKYWWLLGAPVHPFNYSPKTLLRILEKNGFVVEATHFNSDYANILGSIQIFFNRGTSRMSTQGALITNPVLKMIFHRLAKLLDAFGKGDAIELISSKNVKHPISGGADERSA